MAIMEKSVSSSKSLEQLLGHDEFINRHLGPSPDEIQSMLETVGASSLSEFIASTAVSYTHLTLPTICSV